MKKLLLLILIITISFLAWSDEYCEDGSCSLQTEKLFSFGNLDPTVTQVEADIINQAYEEFDKDPEKGMKMLLQKAHDKSTEAIDFSMASFYYSLENFEKSVEWYRKALAKNERFNRARANLAQVLLRMGKPDEAVKEFEKVAELGNISPKTWTLIGYTYMLLEKPVSAENAYRQAMLLDGNDRAALSGLARCLLMQGRYNECIYAVKEIIKEDSGNQDLWYILTNCYTETGNIREAINTLETADIITSENYNTYIALGNLYLMNRQPDYSYKNYTKAFKSEKTEAEDIIKAAGNLFEYGNAEEAYEIINRNRKKIKEDTEQDRRLSIIETGILISTGKLSQAENILEKLQEKYPLDSSILIMSGDLSLKQKKYEKAIIYYERAERTAEDRSSVIIKQAKVEVERENYTKAAELLETAQKLNPQPYIEKYLQQVRRFAE